MSKFHFYTNGEVTIKVYPESIIPEGFYKGKHNQKPAWNKGLTKDDPRVAKYARTGEQNSMFGKPAWNRGLTKETDERVLKYSKNLQGENNPMFGIHRDAWNKGLTKETSESVNKISKSHLGKDTWNKGLTKETDERLQIFSKPRPKEVRDKIRDTHLTDECRLKRYNTMKENGTFAKSKPEDLFYEFLQSYFSQDDIYRWYGKDSRYPFQCDFYISSIDLFIECNFFFTHGSHPFDFNNQDDVKELNRLKQVAEDKHGLYDANVYVWSELDVKKLQTAIDNNLNYMMFYSYSYEKPGEFMETPFYIVDNHELRFIDNEQSATTIESIFKKKNLEEQASRVELK